MTYAAGFDAGERQAFAHRTTGQRLMRPAQLRSAWDQGFWAGYMPRSAEWARAVRAVTEADWAVAQEIER